VAGLDALLLLTVEACLRCAGGLGRRGRPAAIEMVRPPTVAAAALARVQQALGSALQGLPGLGLRHGGASPASSGRGAATALKAIPEDVP